MIGGELAFSTGLGGSIVVANSPQLLISMLYILYNDLLTRIHLGREWSSYATKRHPLRVTQPRGAQRGSYYLSLPWIFAVPLLVLMVVLHWLVSQSIFLGYVTAQDYAIGGRNPVNLGAVVSGLGWSPLALIFSLLVGGILILGLWAAGFAFRYGTGMPLVRSSSLVISAACHPAKWDTDAAVKSVMYGVLEDDQAENERLRVAFSSGPVMPLVPGEIYI